MPAIDVLKLAQNEGKDKSKNADFSLAFVGESGPNMICHDTLT